LKKRTPDEVEKDWINSYKVLKQIKSKRHFKKMSREWKSRVLLPESWISYLGELEEELKGKYS